MNQQPFLPFALPDIGEEEIAEVVDSLRSGWITTGPKTKKFENDFSNFLDSNLHAIALNSATAGLHLALEAIGVSEGDEVITTTYTFTSSAEVVRYLGANPIFVDIDQETLNLDINKVEAAITSKTKAIIPVHFAGLACDMQSLLTLAKKYKLKVIEDAAHALPSDYQGKRIGTLDSDATVFSFYATKTISTGEGGMLVTKSAEIAERCRVMRLHGISRDAFDRYRSTKPAWQYEVIAPGYKYNMTDVASAMGIHQLKKAIYFQERRESMADRYLKELAGLPIKQPMRAPIGDLHSWHLYVIRLLPTACLSRNAFIEAMSTKGIGCSVHFIPLHIQPYWRDTYNLKANDFPNAFEAYEQAVSLPIYTKMSYEDQSRVIRAVKEVLEV